MNPKHVQSIHHANINVNLIEENATHINGWDQWWNNDKCLCGCKKRHICEKIMFRILLHVIMRVENI